MFLKAYRVRSSSQLKSSDKKKLRNDVLAAFPDLSQEQAAICIPQKEEVTLNKVYTFGGDAVLVYSHGKNPIFFQLEKQKTFFPTVYTLWQFPHMLSGFPTWPLVLPKIANGADLMLPGIVVDLSLGQKAFLDGKIKKGDPLCVYLTDNQAAVAVGTAVHCSEDMYMAGNRGKGVTILHFYGDMLWQSGSQVKLPEMGAPDGLDFLKKKQDEEENENDPFTDEEDADVKEKEVAVEDALIEDLEVVTLEDEKLAREEQDEEPGPDCNIKEEAKEDNRSPQEIMDELLRNAFLQAWKTSAKKAELPMLTSNFFRAHMVHQCPKDKVLDVKKSSYKKLSKFLQAMGKEELIVVRELQKGVESITAVNFQHEAIQRFRVVKVAQDTNEDEQEEVLPCDKKYEPPKITELVTVSGNTANFFKAVGKGKGEALTKVQLRTVLKEYVKQHELQNPSNKGVLNLDPLLAGVVLKKDENDVTSMAWEEAAERIAAKMSVGYSLEFPGQPAKVRKGNLEPITLTTANRSGNKKVTLVHNLEVFGINPHEFAHKCQVGVAASTSVHEAAHKKAGAIEVLVQGNQSAFISKLLLEKYKIPRKYIKGLEEAKKKNKQR